MVKVTLAKVLKKKRISKRRFAKMLGIEYRSAFRITQENSNPTLRTLEKWAKLLKCRIRDLYKE